MSGFHSEDEAKTVQRQLVMCKWKRTLDTYQGYVNILLSFDRSSIIILIIGELDMSEKRLIYILVKII